MTISINLDKAKNLKKESLRSERKPLLEAQDVLYMRAQEAGEDTTSIVAEKHVYGTLPTWWIVLPV